MTDNARTLVVALMVLAATPVLGGCGNTPPAPSGPSPIVTMSRQPKTILLAIFLTTRHWCRSSRRTTCSRFRCRRGWAQTSDDTATVFTDKLNAVRVDTHNRATRPSVISAAADELTGIESSTAGYRAGAISVVERPARQAVLISYQATSAPNPVTGKTGIDAVERYEFWRDGREVILTRHSPVDADNVDPWRAITDSLRWQ